MRQQKKHENAKIYSEENNLLKTQKKGNGDRVLQEGGAGYHHQGGAAPTNKTKKPEPTSQSPPARAHQPEAARAHQPEPTSHGGEAARAHQPIEVSTLMDSPRGEATTQAEDEEQGWAKVGKRNH